MSSRLCKASRHPLPDFLIIGAHKAGTTSLYDYLTQHPQVMSAKRKELHFFSKNYHRGIDWYRQRFPSFDARAERQETTGKRVLTGEGTPYYLFHPHAARRIARDLPEAKLIVLLREPVARAYSHYQHEVRLGHETLSFENAIRAESKRLDGELAKMLADERHYSFNHQHFAYRARGIYVDQLQVYSQVIPRERLLILSSDELFSDPQTTFATTLAFLGLDDVPIADMKPRNAGEYDRSLTLPICDELEAFFKPHNRRLFEFLGRDFGWPADAAAGTPRC
jgi:hypothetical protein